MRLIFNTIPVMSWRLSGNSVFKSVQLTFLLWYFVVSRKLFGYKDVFPIGFSWNRKNFQIYFEIPADIAVLREIFVDLEYEWQPITEPKIIIDLGAHFGDTAIYYACRFPKAKVYAIEPSPTNYERLKLHVASFPNIIPIQAAIGSEDKIVELNLVLSSLGHSIIQRKDSVGTVSVEQISLPTLFKKYDISFVDFIKFDIEGGEFDLFANTKVSNFTKACIGEIHFDLDVNFNLDNLPELFRGFSYELQKINQNRYLIRAS